MVAMEGETKSVEPVGETAPATPVEPSQERAAPPRDDAMARPVPTYPEQLTGNVVDQIV